MDCKLEPCWEMDLDVEEFRLEHEELEDQWLDLVCSLLDWFV